MSWKLNKINESQGQFCTQISRITLHYLWQWTASDSAFWFVSSAVPNTRFIKHDVRLFILPVWICNYRGGTRIQIARYYLTTQNYTEIHPQIWQTEGAEEQTLCRSCADSPVCDTNTHTHTRARARHWGHMYAVRIIQLFAIQILCLTSSKALPGTQSAYQQITEGSANIPEIYWTNWGKRQITVGLEFEFHKKPVDHDIP
jgi:hypothetical protein